MRRLVFATNNPHKLAEARAIAAGRAEILSPAEAGVAEADVEETASTLRGNALIKARWLAEQLPGCDCFADDTGLVTEALDGEPGVLSARYAGPECDPQANMAKLLSRLEGKTDRRAAFVTEIALIEAARPNEPRYFTGRVDGEILAEKSGAEGFGYDPLFRPAGYDATFAQMSAAEKNAISHRGRALSAMLDAICRDKE